MERDNTMNTENNTLVVVQLTGGNDFMNTVVPYTNGHYYDSRKTIVLGESDVLPINVQASVRRGKDGGSPGHRLP